MQWSSLTVLLLITLGSLDLVVIVILIHILAVDISPLFFKFVRKERKKT